MLFLNEFFDPCNNSASFNIFIGSDFSASSNDLTIIHMNIRSMRRNFDSLCSYLYNCLSVIPQIIVLSEIWVFDHELCNYSIPGYNLYAECDEKYPSGGIAVYVQNTIVIAEVSTPDLSGADCAVLKIDLITLL